MFYETATMTVGNPLAQAMLAALSTVPGAKLLTTPTVHLYTAGPVPVVPTTLPAAFTEATFIGYAATALPTLIGPINLPSGEGQGMTADVTFLCTTSGTGQNILGYWIDNTSTDMYYGESFPTPIPIALAGDFLTLNIVLPILTPAKAN
jgi:hypothetical protein